MKRSSRISMTLAASATVLGVALPSSAMAATGSPAAALRPLTGSSCDYAHVTTYECTTVTGSGLKITSISGWAGAPTDHTYKDSYIEFYGPNGYITKTGLFTLPGDGKSSTYTWHNPKPTANMTPGDYCTELYASGLSTASDCIDVHS